MTGEQLVKAQIVEFAWTEAAASGALVNILAVACVLRNRVQAGWFGGDWLAVIHHAGEAAAHEGQERVYFDITDNNLDGLLREVDDIYYGVFTEDITVAQGSRALYWCFVDRPIRDWFRDKVIQHEAHPRMATAGMLNLFG